MQCNCADLDALENADLIFIGLTHRVDVARTTSTQNPMIPLGGSPGGRSSSRSSSEQDDAEPFEAQSKAIGEKVIQQSTS